MVSSWSDHGLSAKLLGRTTEKASPISPFICLGGYSQLVLCQIKFVFKNKNNIILPANWAFCHVIVQAVTAFFLYFTI